MSLPSIPKKVQRLEPIGGGAWFYESDGKKTGPLSFREMREAAAHGDFSTEDELWREGENPRLAGSVLGLFPKSKMAPKTSCSLSPAEKKTLTDLSERDVYAPPREQSIMDGPPGGLYLPHLRKSSFGLLLFLFVAGAAMLTLGFLANHDSARLMLMTFGTVMWAIWGLFSLIYLHRAWEMMTMLGAPLGGNKVVAWMLVPVFNAIWSFVALVGWARLWNRNAKNHPGLSNAWGVFLPAFFLFSLSFLGLQLWLIYFSIENIHFLDFQSDFMRIGIGLAAALLIFTLWSWFHLCASINFLARKKS